MLVADVFHEAIGAILEGIFGQVLSTPQNIYTWLTQPVLDPLSSGRVTMDYLMKVVTTALGGTYSAGENRGYVPGHPSDQMHHFLIVSSNFLPIKNGKRELLVQKSAESSKEECGS